MSHSEPAPAGDTPFTPAEIAELRKADLIAGRNVVCLMLGIFLVGVALYLGVDYFVAQG